MLPLPSFILFATFAVTSSTFPSYASVTVYHLGPEGSNLRRYAPRGTPTDQPSRNEFDVSHSKHRTVTKIPSSFEIAQDGNRGTSPEHHETPLHADSTGNTPLHVAVMHKNKKKVKQLLQQDHIEVDARNKHGETPLHIAAGSKDTDIAELLISRKADINAKDDGGDTPIHIAARYGSHDMVRFLLRYKPDAYAENRSGRTPLLVAKDFRHKDIIRTLEKWHAREELRKKNRGVVRSWTLFCKHQFTKITNSHSGKVCTAVAPIIWNSGGAAGDIVAFVNHCTEGNVAGAVGSGLPAISACCTTMQKCYEAYQEVQKINTHQFGKGVPVDHHVSHDKIEDWSLIDVKDSHSVSSKPHENGWEMVNEHSNPGHPPSSMAVELSKSGMGRGSYRSRWVPDARRRYY